jgi:hypothetical protein
MIPPKPRRNVTRAVAAPAAAASGDSVATVQSKIANALAALTAVTSNQFTPNEVADLDDLIDRGGAVSAALVAAADPDAVQNALTIADWAAMANVETAADDMRSIDWTALDSLSRIKVLTLLGRLETIASTVAIAVTRRAGM